MSKKSQQEDAQQVLGVKLESFLNMDHEFVQLSKVIDWSSLGDEYDLLYDSKSGRPPLPSRVMVAFIF